MKKRTLWILLFSAAVLLVLALTVKPQQQTPVSKENVDNFAALLTDLVSAYEAPSEQDGQTLTADLEAIRSVSRTDYETAKAIADHWQAVYLDPDYRLFLYSGDDPVATTDDAGIPNSRSHAIVVLGFALSDGQMQPELTGRCDAAAALAKAVPEAILVCSGGATGGNNPEGHTEAGLMKAYLSECCGIEASRIYTDEKAMTTAENAANTLEILKANKIRTMTIVTSAYHQRWGQTLYNLYAELYRQQHNYSVRIVGNYCYDIDPSSSSYVRDDRIAVQQMAGILKLPQGAVHFPSSALPSPSEESSSPDAAQEVLPAA